MIFEVRQSELFRFKFHSLGSKILKFPEFNLNIGSVFDLNGFIPSICFNRNTSDRRFVIEDLTVLSVKRLTRKKTQRVIISDKVCDVVKYIAQFPFMF